MNSELLIGRSLGISLTVKDLQKSITYYQDVLGFAVDRKFEREGKLQGVTMKAGDVSISINQDDGAKGWERVKGEGFSLRIITDQSIDAIAGRIKKHGGTLDSEPADMPWGSRAFRFRDPDGYRFSISSPRPA
ncbi:MAG: VOC family protein [Bacteroidota bacterium]